MYKGAELIIDFIPGDSCKQTSSINELGKVLNDSDYEIILDLGCGNGNSVDYFKEKNPNVKWIGIDIESSPEVNSRTRKDAEFYTYDGVNIPFTDNYFDLIYSHQVFEHVHRPSDLMKEISRVLKTKGIFIGSTSHLEAFHSYSTFNYTPYGFSLLLKDTELKLIEMRPGIDVFMLILSRIFNRFHFISKLISIFFAKESPINFLVGFIGKLIGKSPQEINLMKLLFCGQFTFYIEKK